MYKLKKTKNTYAELACCCWWEPNEEIWGRTKDVEGIKMSLIIWMHIACVCCVSWLYVFAGDSIPFLVWWLWEYFSCGVGWMDDNVHAKSVWWRWRSPKECAFSQMWADSRHVYIYIYTYSLSYTLGWLEFYWVLICTNKSVSDVLSCWIKYEMMGRRSHDELRRPNKYIFEK